MRTLALSLLFGFLPLGFVPAEESSSLELFEQRIMPIFKSAKPSSCVQCHLAAVDLKDYIKPSHEQTFVSLYANGLIDAKQPRQSKILKLIEMGDRDPDPRTRRLHEKTRQAEYEAFAAWIQASCSDPKMMKLAEQGELAVETGPKRPLDVVRHTRKSRVIDSFARNIWAQRMRCFPCHTPNELDENNPRHKTAMKRVKEMEAKFGADRLRIFKKTPAATLQYLVEASKETEPGRLPLLNLKDPEKSLLLLKPTAKLPKRLENKQFEAPSYNEPVSHMGGLKIHVDDPAYKAFVSWIRDYSRVVGDKYATVDQLPADNWRPTKQFLAFFKTPEAWTPQRPVQMTVHPWDESKNDWAEAPIAFTQNKTTPRGRIVGALFALGDESSPYVRPSEGGNVAIKPGRYLVKTFLDRDGKLADDPTLMLGEEDLFGQVELEAQWQEGFPKSQKVSAETLQSP